MSLICPGPSGGGGGLTFESSATAGDRTAVMNTFTRVDCSAGDVFITLPASGSSDDRVAVANEVGTNSVIVQPDGTDTLDGIVSGAWYLKPGEVATWIFDGVDTWVRESRSTLSILNLDQTGDDYIESTASTMDFYRGGSLRWSVAGAGITSNLPIIPGTDNLFDLGSASLRWRDLFIDTVGSAAVPSTAMYTNQLFLEPTGAGLRFVAISSTRLTLRFNTGNINYEWTTSAFYPDGLKTLGTLGASWDALYLTENGTGLVLDADGDTYIIGPADDFIDFYAGAVLQFRVTSAEVRSNRVLNTVSGLRPNAAGGADIGTSSIPYQDLYLSNGGGQIVWTAANTYIQGDTGAARMRMFVGANQVLDLTANTVSFAPTGTNHAVMDGTSFSPRNSLELGDLSNPWPALYMSEAGTGIVLDTDGDTYILSPSDDIIQLFGGGSEIARIVGGATGVDGFRPGTSNAYDLGATTRYWRNIFIAGDLRPSTTSVELGTSSVGLGAVYMNQGGTGIVLDADGDSYIVASADDVLDIYIGGVLKQRFNSTLSIDFYDAVNPDTDGGQALGFSSRQWGELQLANGSANGVYFDAEANQIYSTNVSTTTSVLVLDANQNSARTVGEISFRLTGTEVMSLEASPNKVQVAGNIRPATDGSHQVGEASFYFDSFYGEALFLDNRGTYTTDPVTDGVAPAAPAAGCVLFMVDTSAGVEEFWVRFASGTAKAVTDDT